jgi:hypothetical protein
VSEGATNLNITALDGYPGSFSIHQNYFAGARDVSSGQIRLQAPPAEAITAMIRHNTFAHGNGYAVLCAEGGRYDVTTFNNRFVGHEARGVSSRCTAAYAGERATAN